MRCCRRGACAAPRFSIGSWPRRRRVRASRSRETNRGRFVFGYGARYGTRVAIAISILRQSHNVWAYRLHAAFAREQRRQLRLKCRVRRPIAILPRELLDPDMRQRKTPVLMPAEFRSAFGLAESAERPQAAKSGTSTCRNRYRIAVIRMMFDGAGGK